MNATDTARQMTKLATRTPIEVDTALANLSGEYDQIVHDLYALLHTLHYIAGDEQDRVKDGFTTHYVWRMDDNDAIVQALENTATGTLGTFDPARATQTVTDWRTGNEAVTTNRAQASRLNAEYLRRPWARYIQAGPTGHVHHDVNCTGSTLDRGRYLTERNWRPDLSGVALADAMPHLGKLAWMLCSFCFPGAPVPEGQANPDECPGSRKHLNKEAGAHRTGYHHGNYGTCPNCHQRVTLTAGWLYKAHDTPEAAARKLQEKATATGKLIVDGEPKTPRAVELAATNPYLSDAERENCIAVLAAHRGDTVEQTRDWANAKRATRR